MRRTKLFTLVLLSALGCASVAAAQTSDEINARNDDTTTTNRRKDDNAGLIGLVGLLGGLGLLGLRRKREEPEVRRQVPVTAH
jgi:LPXTG-motif cell wall-anchored protein